MKRLNNAINAAVIKMEPVMPWLGILPLIAIIYAALVLMAIGYGMPAHTFVDVLLTQLFG